jgi:tetratricopeptide (TPR) repeat protein
VALGLGNVAQARTVFELATHSGEPAVRQPAFSGLGEVHLALGDVPAAAHAFDQAREPAATAVGEYAAFQRARLHLQLQEYSEAVAIFQRLIASAHARVAQDAGIALALAYLQQGETDIARRQLEAIRQQRQGQTAAVRAGYYLALILVEEGGAEAARTLCEDVLAKAPQSDEAVDARLLLAELMLRERPAPEVIVWLRRAYQSPGLPARHRGKLAKRLGDFAREQGAYGDALRWYDEAERWWPAARGEVRYRAASCLEEAGDLDAAIQRYRTVDQPPWQVRGRLAVAKLLERQGRLPEAEVIYESLAAEPIAEAKVVKERLAALRGRSRDEEWE